eukprot:950091_1
MNGTRRNRRNTQRTHRQIEARPNKKRRIQDSLQESHSYKPDVLAEVPRCEIMTQAFPKPQSFKFVRGQEFPKDESRTVEFKQVCPSYIFRNSAKYVNAFLNSEGGSIYFGIDDDGIIEGISLNRNQRDKIRCNLDHAFSRPPTPVDTSLYKMQFHNVYPENGTSNPYLDHCVFVIKVKKGNGLYTTHDHKMWTRMDGSVREFTARMRSERKRAAKRERIGHLEQKIRVLKETVRKQKSVISSTIAQQLQLRSCRSPSLSPHPRSLSPPIVPNISAFNGEITKRSAMSHSSVPQRPVVSHSSASRSNLKAFRSKNSQRPVVSHSNTYDQCVPKSLRTEPCQRPVLSHSSTSDKNLKTTLYTKPAQRLDLSRITEKSLCSEPARHSDLCDSTDSDYSSNQLSSFPEPFRVSKSHKAISRNQFQARKEIAVPSGKSRELQNSGTLGKQFDSKRSHVTSQQTSGTSQMNYSAHTTIGKTQSQRSNSKISTVPRKQFQIYNPTATATHKLNVSHNLNRLKTQFESQKSDTTPRPSLITSQAIATHQRPAVPVGMTPFCRTIEPASRVSNVTPEQRLRIERNRAKALKIRAMRQSKSQRPVIHKQHTPSQRPVILKQQNQSQRPVIQKQQTQSQRPVIHKQTTRSQRSVTPQQQTQSQQPVIQKQQNQTQRPIIHKQQSHDVSTLPLKQNQSKRSIQEHSHTSIVTAEQMRRRDENRARAKEIRDMKQRLKKLVSKAHNSMPSMFSASTHIQTKRCALSNASIPESRKKK